MPPFFAHEGAVIDLLASHPVPRLLGRDGPRVLLARLAVRQAPLWILDEPFTVLDVKAVEMLSYLIEDHLAGDGLVILTSHQSMPLPNGKVLKL